MHNIYKQTYSLTAILRYLHHRYFIYITPLVMIIIPNKLYCFGGMRLETYFFDKFSGAVSPEADRGSHSAAPSCYRKTETVAPS